MGYEPSKINHIFTNTSSKVDDIFDLFSKTLSDKKVLVIGDAMLYLNVHCKEGDRSVHQTHAKERILDVEYYKGVPGGVYRIARVLKEIFKEVHVVATRGKDTEGDKLVGALKEEELRSFVSDLIVDNDKKTTVKIRVFMDSERLEIRLDHEDRQNIIDQVWKKVLDRIKRHIDKVDAVIIRDYKKGLLEEERIKMILELAKPTTKFIINSKSEWKLYTFGSCPRVIDVLRTNEEGLEYAIELQKVQEIKEEVKGLAGEDQVKQLCKKYAYELFNKNYHSNLFVVTLGKNGSFLVDRTKNFGIAEVYYIKPTPLRGERKNVIGAGNEFLSYFACSILSGISPQISLQLANVAASMGIERSLEEWPVRIGELKQRFNTEQSVAEKIDEFVDKREARIFKIIQSNKILLSDARNINGIIFNANTEFGKLLEDLYATLQKWNSRYEDGNRKDLIVFDGETKSGKTTVAEKFLETTRLKPIHKTKIGEIMNVNDYKKNLADCRSAIIDDIFTNDTEKILALIGEGEGDLDMQLQNICFVLIYRDTVAQDVLNRAMRVVSFPNLHERIEDLPYLILNHFKKKDLKVRTISQGALACLLRYKYNGFAEFEDNVKKNKELSGFAEFEKLLDKVVENVGDENIILIKHLPNKLKSLASQDDKYIQIEFK